MKQLIFGSLLLINIAILIYLIYDIFYLDNMSNIKTIFLIIFSLSFIVLGILSLALKVFFELAGLSGQ